MKPTTEVVTSGITVLVTRDVPTLDPVTVVLMDLGSFNASGRTFYAGRLIVECYGEAWASYWNAMGAPLRDFVAKTDTGYLVRNLWPDHERETKRRNEYLRKIVACVQTSCEVAR